MKNNNKNYRKNKSKKHFVADRPIPIKKLRLIIIIPFIVFSLLIIRIFWIQFINGSWLKERAYRQQTASTIITPDRGAILDVNSKSLAISEKVDTISVNPSKIKDEKKALVAKGLSDIFELDFDETFEKVNSSSSVETIIKKVQNDKVIELQNWMSENKISVGINIDDDNKRYYPYSSIASQVIGFCGTDNNGLAGIESSYDNILSGRSGKIITTTDLNNSEISDNYSTYIEAQNGSDVYLTIDINIQSIVEKCIKTPVDEKLCESSSTIIMDPSTGNILAMASYPNFDLNTPFEPNTEAAKSNWDSMSTDEKSTFLNKMWRNKTVSDLYEPGSTFKTLVSSIALEENITETDIKGDFYCKGYEDISGTKIRCWSTNSHGYQTLEQALGNSCNPAFMQLGKRIGVDTFYKYFDAYGLFNKTGITLPGEAKSIFFDKEKVGPVELATMSFGQRFTITPLQLITATCSLANGGKLVKPQIVSKIVNTDNDSVTSTQPEVIRQVVSEETANYVIDMMEYVMTNGTGKPANVKGYTIAGKSGTSEAISSSNEGNTISFVAVAPAENPKLVILTILYNMSHKNTHGGTEVGPIVSKILSETLPYLGINSDENSIDASTSNSISIPDVVNKTVAEAEKLLKNSGLNVVTYCDGDKNSCIVSNQVPSARTIILKDSTVIIYSENNEARTSISVPNLTDMSLTQAKAALRQRNLNISYSGTGLVASQDIKAGTSVEEGTIISVKLAH